MNILYLNHYAGTPFLGMEFRPYYLAREWVRLGHTVQMLAAGFSHVRARQPDVGQAPKDEAIDGIAYRWYPAPPYQGNGLDRVKNIAAALAQLQPRAGRIAQHNHDWVREHALFAPCVERFVARLDALGGERG
jgi:hypothetical protein